jgi:hypothetical protein
LLVHKGCDTREYDNKIHEETMFYFNRMVRVQYYEHGVDCPGIDHCFDCARTVQILSNHLTRHDGWFEGVRNAETMKLETELPAEALNAEVKKMILRINEDLDKIRHSKSNQENAELQNDLHQHHQHLQQQQDEAQQHLHHHQQDEAVIVQGGANEEEAEVDYEGL